MSPVCCSTLLLILLAWNAEAQTITTIAGTGPLGDGGPATSAPLIGPGGVAVDAGGNLFIADAGNQRVRKVDLARPAITSPPPGAVLLGTSFTMTLASSVPPGAYQVRVIGLSATGQPVGVFSDALTVMVQ